MSIAKMPCNVHIGQAQVTSTLRLVFNFSEYSVLIHCLHEVTAMIQFQIGHYMLILNAFSL